MASYGPACLAKGKAMEKAGGQSEPGQKIVAFIPARAGSSRIRLKNIRKLNGHPLIAHTIEQAHLSGIFARIFVSTDSPDIARAARHYGAEVIYRPTWTATDESPDYEWVHDAILQTKALEYDAYAILRPTSPFRQVASIVHAWEMLKANPTYDSVRAIRPVKEHPCKMWRYWKFDDWSGRITPFLPLVRGYVPAYDMPTQSFDQVWVQSGALQVHWVAPNRRYDITGDKIMGIILGQYESVDLNTPDDWDYAEYLIKGGKVRPILGKRSFWKWLNK